MKQKKAAAAQPQTQPLATSINSDTDALAMSYNDAANNNTNDDEELTEEEAQKARKRSSFNSFISPAERKRRQQEKLDAIHKKEQQGEQQTTTTQEEDTPHPPAEDETSEISMTDSEKQRVEVVQKTSFISPMERKKRALERQRSMEAEIKAKNSSGNNINNDDDDDGGDVVVTKSSSVSSSIAKFNETFGKKETKRSFNESLEKKATAVLNKSSSINSTTTRK